MRIRLEIARHELPLVKILWNVAREAVTISRLLEQVHDAIPLESDGWGIEDYAVEVNGYEALHYLNPHTILHEEDQVTVRALQTPDIRVRSLSGRYQIASSGAHLIDGIAFGKTYLRRPHRPSVRIPHRKRSRLLHEYEEEYDDEEEDRRNAHRHENKRLRIEDNFQDGKEEVQEPDLGNEDTTPSFVSDDTSSNSLSRSGKRRKSVSFDETSFSGAHDHEDEDDDGEDYEPDEDDELHDEDDGSDSDDDDDQDMDGTEVPDDASTGAEHHTEAVKQLTNGMQITETPRSGASRATRKADASSNSPVASADSSPSDSNSSQSSASDDASDSSDSSDSDSSGDEPEVAPSKPSKSPSRSRQSAKKKVVKAKESKTVESTTGFGNGMSSTRARNSRRNQSRRLNHLKRTGQIGPDDSLTDLRARSSKPDGSQEDEVDIGETEFMQRRNELLDSLEAGGVDKDSLAAIGPQAYPSLQAASSETPILTPSFQQKSPDSAKSVTNNSNIIENTSSQVQPMEATSPVQTTTSPSNAQDTMDNASSQVQPIETTSPAQTSTSPSNAQNTTDNASSQMQSIEATSPAQTSTSPSNAQDTTDAATRQAEVGKSKFKLNLASSNRLIFGSLGVRTPRTKAEQDKIREILSGETKAKPASRNAEAVKEREEPSKQTEPQPAIPDSEGWKRKIRLMAVECSTPEIGGKLLGQPPFPYKQGWDPSASMKGKKRKRSNQRFFVGEPREGQLPTPLPYYLEQKVSEEAAANDFDYPHGEGLNYDDSMEYSQEEDLPTLPADMAGLPAFELKNALPGTIIAFKQSELSEATAWQPGMSGYKTASIIGFDVDTSVLQLQLAIRDIPDLTRERDSQGHRVCGKSQVAADDDDNLALDGVIAIAFIELGEPKIVRAAESSSTSQIVYYDELRNDESQASGGFASAAKSGRSRAGGLVHEASA